MSVCKEPFYFIFLYITICVVWFLEHISQQSEYIYLTFVSFLSYLNLLLLDVTFKYTKIVIYLF